MVVASAAAVTAAMAIVRAHGRACSEMKQCVCWKWSHGHGVMFARIWRSRGRNNGALVKRVPGDWKVSRLSHGGPQMRRNAVELEPASHAVARNYGSLFAGTLRIVEDEEELQRRLRQLNAPLIWNDCRGMSLLQGRLPRGSRKSHGALFRNV